MVDKVDVEWVESAAMAVVDLSVEVAQKRVPTQMMVVQVEVAVGELDRVALVEVVGELERVALVEVVVGELERVALVGVAEDLLDLVVRIEVAVGALD